MAVTENEALSRPDSPAIEAPKVKGGLKVAEPAKPVTKEKVVQQSPPPMMSKMASNSPAEVTPALELKNEVPADNSTPASPGTIIVDANGKKKEKRRRLAALEDLLELCRENGYDQ